MFTFGQSSGATFGQPSFGFGQSSSGSGSMFGGFGGFGQSSSQGFGFGQSSQAFGAPSSGSFGGFGGLGQPSSSGFGFGQPAFGQSSSAGFGGFGFGQSSSGGLAFGQPSSGGFGGFGQAPAFGQPSSSAGFGFGQPTGFGQSSSAGFGGFGQPAPGANPFSGGAPLYPKFEKFTTQEGSPPMTVNFQSITRLDPFRNYSVEQYHWLDYEAKMQNRPSLWAQLPDAQKAQGATAQKPPTSAQAFGGFGQPASSSSAGFGAFGGFGQPSSSGGMFGGSVGGFGGFGPSSSSFGGFGGFGAPSSSASSSFGGFGAPAGTTPFGQSSTTPFGGGLGSFGQPSSSSPFGMGMPTSSSPFGGFGQSSGGFGGFGASSSAANPFGGGGFGGFGHSSSAAAGFGGFGAPSSSASFGFSASPFGQSSQQGFGQSAPAFGFGSSSATGFGFGSSSAPSFGFGASSSSAGFGNFGGFPQSSSGGSFGAAPFGGFGASSSANTFGFKPSSSGFGFGMSSSAPAFGFGGFSSSVASPFGSPGFGSFGSPSPSPFGAPINTFGAPSPFGFNALQQPMLPQGTPQDALGIALAPYGNNPVFNLITHSASADATFSSSSALSIVSVKSPASSPQPPTLSGLTTPVFARPRDRSIPRSALWTSSLFSNVAMEEEKRPAITPAKSVINTELFCSPMKDLRALVFQEPDTLPGEGHLGAPGSPPPSWVEAGEQTPGPLSLSVMDTPGSVKKALTSHFDTPNTKLPTMQGGEYTIRPSLAELLSYSAEELQRVPNFEVVKEGVGRLRFLRPVDLTGVRLDAVVRILPGEVGLYLDGLEAPPPGQGLNVDAECTLFGVFPKKHEAGQPFEGRRLERFMQKLQDVPSTEFQEYDGETGTWKFIVRAGDWKQAA